MSFCVRTFFKSCSFLGVTALLTACTVHVRAPILFTTSRAPAALVATNHLVFSVQPSTAVAGVAINSAVKVSVVNAAGQVVTTDTSTITLAFQNNAGSGSLLGTLAQTASAGVATFSNLTIQQAATGYTLVATAGSLTASVSSGFNVIPSVAGRLGFFVQPTTAIASAAISPAIVVAVEDIYGNMISSSTAQVTLGILNNPSGGTLSGSITANAVSGLATFSGLSIEDIGTGYTLGAFSNSYISATSSSFNIGLPVNQDQFVQTGLDFNVSPTTSIADSQGNVYVLGYHNDTSSIYHWVVRRKSGGTWSIMDDYVYPGGGRSQGYALGLDSAGNLYAGGMGWDLSERGHWIVRKYSNGVWTTIDDYLYSNTTDPTLGPAAIKVDSSGNIFVVGTEIDNSFVAHWIVREYTAGSWTNIEDYQYTSGLSAAAGDILIDSSGNLIVSGYGYDNSSVAHGLVRKYLSGSWSASLIDDYSYTAGQQTYIEKIKLNSTGVLFGVAISYDGSNIAHWLTRQYSGAGQVWSVLDDYQYAAGKAASAFSIAVDPSDNLFVVGYAIDSSNLQHWITRKYSSGVWTTFDDFQYQAPAYSTASTICIDSTGKLYSAGSARDSSNQNHWVVRDYSSGAWATDDVFNPSSGSAQANAVVVAPGGVIYTAGVSNGLWVVRMYSGGVWSTIDTYRYAANQAVVAYGVILDSSGNLYVGGAAYEGGGIQHWVVRKYSGGSWTVSDDFQYANNASSVVNGMAVDSVGNIYAVGFGYDGSNRNHWVVRMLSGGVWTTVDDYNYVNGGIANSIALDSSNNIYVVGYAFDNSFAYHWIVREYTAGAWTTIDDYQYMGTNINFANSVAIDSSGNAFVGGEINSGGFHWMVRECTAGSCSLSDDFQVLAGQINENYGMAADVSGNVYAAGIGGDSSGVNYWTVRKFNGSSWSTIQSYTLDNEISATAKALAWDPSIGKVIVTGSAGDNLGDNLWITKTAP